MEVLVVVAHPRQDSLTCELARRFCAGLRAAGHTATEADLYAEGFDPVVRPQEFTNWGQREVSVAARIEQERLERAQGLALVYPLWWSTPPAVLQGWLQRVFTQGFAFEYGAGPHGRLRHKTQLIVSIGSRDQAQYSRYIEPILEVLRYCGITEIQTLVNWGVYPDAPQENIQGFLDAAYQSGLSF